MNELKPKLFDVLKDYSKEQAMRDVISGNAFFYELRLFT
jgi:SulP family sulfate permease